MFKKLQLNPEDYVGQPEAVVEQFVKDYGWDGPVFAISALDGSGCSALTYAIMDYLATQAPRPVEDESAADAPASETPADTPATDTPAAD